MHKFDSGEIIQSIDNMSLAALNENYDDYRILHIKEGDEFEVLTSNEVVSTLKHIKSNNEVVITSEVYDDFELI